MYSCRSAAASASRSPIADRAAAASPRSSAACACARIASARARLGNQRLADDGLIGGAELTRQRLRQLKARGLRRLLARPDDRILIERGEHHHSARDDRAPFQVGRPLDPQLRKGAPPARRGRGVDEARLLQRLDAFGDDAVGYVDALALVEGAQTLDELFLSDVLVELALDQALAMAQGVDHVHREHHLVQGRRCRPARLRRRRFDRRHQSGRALPSATSFASRRLPSSTASRISAEFWVESLRISSMISRERSWKLTTESTSFLTASARMVGP